MSQEGLQMASRRGLLSGLVPNDLHVLGRMLVKIHNGLRKAPSHGLRQESALAAFEQRPEAALRSNVGNPLSV